MSHQKDGRHCMQCNKTVVDFTQMSTAEITQYFNQRKGEHVCGRYLHVQVHKKGIGSMLLSLRDNIRQFKGARIAAVAITAILLSLNSCIMGKKAEPLTGHLQHSEKDSLSNHNNYPQTNLKKH